MVKFKVEIQAKAIEGKEQDVETVLDAFAYALGHENGAMDGAFTFVAYTDLGDTEPTKYQVWLVDA